MLSKEEVQNLQTMRGTAMVSIIVPVDHSFNGSEKNAAILKDLIRATKEKLIKNYDPYRVSQLMDKLQILEQEIDYHESMKGVALYVSDDYSKIVSLPFAPVERTCIGRSFETRDLLLGLENKYEYLLLSLSLGKIHLYRGIGNEISEIKDGFFPAQHRPIERSNPVDGFEHVDKEELEDMKIFLRSAGENVFQMVQTNKMPLFIAGEDKYLSFFQEHTPSGKHVNGRFSFSLHDMSDNQIAEKILPEIEKYYEADKQALIAQFEEAKGGGKAVKGLIKVWKAAKINQIHTLLVEENYRQSGRTKTSDELELIFEDDAMGLMATWHDDLVNDVMEMVSKANGNVVFYKDGQLTKQERIGAILRYS